MSRPKTTSTMKTGISLQKANPAIKEGKSAVPLLFGLGVVVGASVWTKKVLIGNNDESSQEK